MAKVDSIDQTERLLLSLDDITDDETSVLDQDGLAQKDSADKVGNVATDLPIAKDQIAEEFDKLLLDAIDDALLSLGMPVKNSIYSHLQNDFCIKREQIPDKIYEFSDILHKIFGLGAGRLEIKCMKNISDKVKVSMAWPEYEWPMSKWVVTDMTFPEYVGNAKRSYIDKRKSNHSNV